MKEQFLFLIMKASWHLFTNADLLAGIIVAFVAFQRALNATEKQPFFNDPVTFACA